MKFEKKCQEQFERSLFKEYKIIKDPLNGLFKILKFNYPRITKIILQI